MDSLKNKIPKTHIRWAIKHIAKEGDTDIISTPFEHSLLRKNKRAVIDALSNIDISNYEWKNTRRFIAQKDAVSFRPVCQLDPIDSILFAALVSQNRKKITHYLAPYRDNVYSHNLVCRDSGEMYVRNDGWVRFWKNSIEKATHTSCKFVAITDLVDYYNQIYHHTLENQLREAGMSQPSQTAFKKLLKFETDKVSRGIPVGPHPSHALGELAMAPIDGFLTQTGINYSRYLDDFHFFVESEAKATIVLMQVAKALDPHKLSLNRSKTRVLSAENFSAEAYKKLANDPINAVEQRFMELLSEYVDDPYDDYDLEEMDDEDREELYGLALDEVLAEYLAADFVDYSRIRWFLRRLAQVGIPGSERFVVEHMNDLLPVISDVAKYLSRITTETTTANEFGKLLAQGLDHEVVSQSEYLSSCLLSSFANSPEYNNFSDIQKHYSGNSMIKRKIVLAAEAQGKTDWIRSLKRDFSSSDIWLKRAIVFACRKLPKDESQTYIKHIRKPYRNDLLFTFVANETLRSIK